MAVRSRARTELIAAVWRKTEGRCWYCGVQTVRPTTFSLDHVVPVSLGGSDDVGNLVVACRRCNSAKRNKTVEEYREHLAMKQGWRFTEAQVRYLEEFCGFTLPEPPVHLFWFEIEDGE